MNYPYISYIRIAIFSSTNHLQRVGPDRYMTTSGQGCTTSVQSNFGTRTTCRFTACTILVQEGERFWYSFWTILVHNEVIVKRL